MMYRTVYLLLGVVLTLSSCIKHGDLYQPQERTANLEVPEGFDWASTRAVELPVSTPVATVASFFLDEACTPQRQIATLLVPEGETTFKFDIPNADKAIYVQYVLESGKLKTLKREIKEEIKSKAITGATDVMFFDQPQLYYSESETTQFINIPDGTEYGTLMFEDTWPEMGDYDFNDVVVNYKIVPTYNLKGINPENSENAPANDIVIKVSLKIRALGGNLPYDFAIQIGQTQAHEGSSFTASHLRDVIDIESTNKDITVEKLEGTEFPAVIVKGLNALRSSGYYNTIMKKDEGVELSFKIRIKGTVKEQGLRMQNGGFSDPNAFDYFLINQKNHREIHLIGFAPTALYTGYDSDNTAGGTYYYQNDKGLVWGLKAPGTLGWAAEKHDIMTVYTEFKRWVTDGGYTIGPNGADPLQWYKYHTTDNFIKP